MEEHFNDLMEAEFCYKWYFVVQVGTEGKSGI